MPDIIDIAGSGERAAADGPHDPIWPGLFARSKLEPEPLARLQGMIRYIDLAKGDTAVSEGQSDPGLLTVVRGVLKLFKQLHDGRRQITGFRFRGDLLTWSSPGQATRISAQAVTDGVLCHIDSQRFREFSASHPAIGDLLQDLAAEESDKQQAHMLTLGRKTPTEKLASFLVEMLRRSNGADHAESGLHLPMTRQDIADYLGLETETTSRIFTRLKEEGVVALPRPNRVLVRDRAALERLASGDGGPVQPFKANCGPTRRCNGA